MTAGKSAENYGKPPTAMGGLPFIKPVSRRNIMKNINLNTYSNQVLSVTKDCFKSDSLPRDLLISQEGQYETFYSPFDFINENAKIVIVGITPGLQQASNSLLKAKEVMESGGSIEKAKEAAKVFASFSGAMRNNLTAMMDHVGLNKYLGISSTKSLFEENQHMVHYTSALRYPVFKNGKNFNESPLKLKEQVMAWFAEECKVLNNAVYVPLGPKVTEVLELMIELGILKSEQVLSGLQHPSGANAERVAYFLGNKEKSLLSVKTNPDTIDISKKSILEKVGLLQRNTSSLIESV